MPTMRRSRRQSRTGALARDGSSVHGLVTVDRQEPAPRRRSPTVMSIRRRPLALLTLAVVPVLLSAGAATAAGTGAASSGDGYTIYQAPAVNPGDTSNDAYNNAVEPSIGRTGRPA